MKKLLIALSIILFVAIGCQNIPSNLPGEPIMNDWAWECYASSLGWTCSAHGMLTATGPLKYVKITVNYYERLGSKIGEVSTVNTAGLKAGESWNWSTPIFSHALYTTSANYEIEWK